MKSTFMTQVKKWLKNNSKKELIKKVVLWIEMNAQQEMRDGEMISNLQEEIEHVMKDLIDTKKELEVAKTNTSIYESSLKYVESELKKYKNMNPYTFFIHKYIK